MREGAAMARFSWIVSRVTAAVFGALLVGLVAAAIEAMVVCGPTCHAVGLDAHGRSTCLENWSACGDVVGGLVFDAIVFSAYAIALGTLPGIIALTLTPARIHPWRSLLVLVPATVLGLALWLLLLYLFHIVDGVAPLILLFFMPTAAGLIAACAIGKLPKRFGLV